MTTPPAGPALSASGGDGRRAGPEGASANLFASLSGYLSRSASFFGPGRALKERRGFAPLFSETRLSPASRWFKDPRFDPAPGSSDCVPPPPTPSAGALTPLFTLLFFVPIISNCCGNGRPRSSPGLPSVSLCGRGVPNLTHITQSGGSLGSCVDEERSQLRELM